MGRIRRKAKRETLAPQHAESTIALAAPTELEDGAIAVIQRAYAAIDYPVTTERMRFNTPDGHPIAWDTQWPDWHHSSAFYQNARHLADRHLAWEFLRRSPAYRQAYIELYQLRKSQAGLAGTNDNAIRALAARVRAQFWIARMSPIPHPLYDPAPLFSIGSEAPRYEPTTELVRVDKDGHHLAFGSAITAAKATIEVNLERPIELAMREFRLALLQAHEAAGIAVRRLPRPATRATQTEATIDKYLRVLDARAAGVTYRAIAGFLLNDADREDAVKRLARKARELANGG
ncbi:MAG TPA: DUF2285 domain-containing protein, partial [Magnetospirillum sp.]|nr:DUF2285 domain-containing protein [Magnetospirillum sp.]